MTRINYLTNAMVPGALGMHMWDQRQVEVADIVVSNELANKYDIAEMDLRLMSFSAFDRNGNEFLIREFSGSGTIRFRSISSAAFLVTRDTLELEPGEYNKLRFYIEPGKGKFIHTDRTVSDTGNREFLDFAIEDTLIVNGKPPVELILRFDFPPFKRFELNTWKNYFIEWTEKWKNRFQRAFS